MFQNRVRSLTLLAVAAAVGASAGVAGAGTMTLGNSGWEAQWPDSANVQLSVVSTDANTLYLSKTATFTSIDNLPITFVQTAVDALPRIAIDTESVTNQTGQDWGGFRWIILSSSTGTMADAQFNTTDTNIGGTNGFSIDPFTDHQYTDSSQTGTVTQPKILDVFNGGTVADGAVYSPGSAGGALVIHAAPNANANYAFTLKEIPASVIPLPAAFWSGLTGLGGLAALGLLRHRRKTI